MDLGLPYTIYTIYYITIIIIILLLLCYYYYYYYIYNYIIYYNWINQFIVRQAEKKLRPSLSAQPTFWPRRIDGKGLDFGTAFMGNEWEHAWEITKTLYLCCRTHI